MNTNYLPCTSDPDAWFNPDTMHQAARICAEQCPLTAECLAACHTMPVSQQHYGVWGALRPEDRNKSLHKPCKTCGELRPSYARGYCRACYKRMKERQRQRPLIDCANCGETKPHKAHGLCVTCYHRNRDAA